MDNKKNYTKLGRILKRELRGTPPEHLLRNRESYVPFYLNAGPSCLTILGIKSVSDIHLHHCNDLQLMSDKKIINVIL